MFAIVDKMGKIIESILEETHFHKLEDARAAYRRMWERESFIPRTFRYRMFWHVDIWECDESGRKIKKVS